MLPTLRPHFPAKPATLKNGEVITLRLLEPTDSEALGEFYLSVPRGDFRFYCPHPMTLAEAEKKATTQADAENHACVVCENAEGKIVGYAWYAWQEAESEKSVFGICIRRGYQEVGTGQAVMRRVLEIAESVGPATMTLTVQKANARAVALYTKMGFRPVRDQERPACYGFDAEPEYYMECSVRNP